jgi:hypothetical protein
MRWTDRVLCIKTITNLVLVIDRAWIFDEQKLFCHRLMSIEPRSLVECLFLRSLAMMGDLYYLWLRPEFWRFKYYRINVMCCLECGHGFIMKLA